MNVHQYLPNYYTGATHKPDAIMTKTGQKEKRKNHRSIVAQVIV